MRERLAGEEVEVLSCSSPAVILLLLSSVEIFGKSLCSRGSFLHTFYYVQPAIRRRGGRGACLHAGYPEAFFFMQFIMRKRLYGSSVLTCYLLGKNDDLLELYQILLEVDL